MTDFNDMLVAADYLEQTGAEGFLEVAEFLREQHAKATAPPKRRDNKIYAVYPGPDASYRDLVRLHSLHPENCFDASGDGMRGRNPEDYVAIRQRDDGLYPLVLRGLQCP